MKRCFQFLFALLLCGFAAALLTAATVPASNPVHGGNYSQKDLLRYIADNTQMASTGSGVATVPSANPVHGANFSQTDLLRYIADYTQEMSALGLAVNQDWKTNVRVASTANATLATAFENGDTLDGVTLATGDRILLKDQSTASQNGIYTVAASGAPSRASDSDTWAELPGSVVVVTAGTANSGTAWRNSSAATGTLDSTSISYTAFGSGGGSVSDAAYGAGWNGDTTTAPSKNAVYDKFESLGGGGFDATAIDSPTWSDGANASNTWTFNLSGTDSTWTQGSNNWIFGVGSIDLGSAGVRISQDGDGALTLLGLGNGNDEDLTINFDDGSANTVNISSSTGVTSIGLGAIGLTSSGEINATTGTFATLSGNAFNVSDSGSGFHGSFSPASLDADYTYTLPSANGTLALLEGNNTWSGTNTFGALTITTLSATNFRVLDSIDQSHAMKIVAGSNLTADRNLTFTTGDAARTVTISGDVTLPAGTALVSGGALGTPSSATLTNATGLPVSTGISGLGTGVATALATPSSANLATAITDETGSGALVFGTKPFIDHGVSMSSDDTCNGTGRSGLNNSGGVTQWDTVYLNSSSQWVLADANGSGTYPCRGLAVATVSTGGATTIITRGTVRNDSWTWTPGGTIYLSTTAGGLTQTAPSTTGDKVQVIGYALDADTMAVEIGTDYGTAP